MRFVGSAIPPERTGSGLAHDPTNRQKRIECDPDRPLGQRNPSVYVSHV